MGAQLPVVATAVGGVPDVLKDGENGLLIPEGDEDALVLALKTLLENPERAKALAKRERLWFKKVIHCFAWRPITKRGIDSCWG